MAVEAYRIRIPSYWVDEETHERRDGVADFKLGPGPCGKVVTGLALKTDQTDISVYQSHTDGSEKVFIYPRHTITGRITVEVPDDA